MTGFNYDEWQADQNRKRYARREEIRQALDQGRKVFQLRSVWPDCSPFLAEWNTPEHLAEHIESREYGFGFETRILN